MTTAKYINNAYVQPIFLRFRCFVPSLQDDLEIGLIITIYRMLFPASDAPAKNAASRSAPENCRKIQRIDFGQDGSCCFPEL